MAGQLAQVKFETRNKHQQQYPQFAEVRNGNAEGGVVYKGQTKDVNQRWAKEHTDEKFPEDRGLPEAGAEVTGGLGSQQDDNQFKGKLQEGGH